MDENLLDRLIREAEAQGTDPPSAHGTEPADVGIPTDAAAASPLVGLLKNPAVLSALPVFLSGGSLPGGMAAGGKKKPDRHTALLVAIKPYLGRERQQTADQLISLCRLWDTLQGSGLTRLLPALLGGAGGAAPTEGTVDGGGEPPKEG